MRQFQTYRWVGVLLVVDAPPSLLHSWCDERVNPTGRKKGDWKSVAAPTADAVEVRGRWCAADDWDEILRGELPN